MKRQGYAILQAVLALMIGAGIYLLFREETVWLRVFAHPGCIRLSRVSFPGDALLRYYLPDFLWGYALASALYAVYPPQGRGGYGPAVVSAIVGAVYEILQACGIFRGTGDAVDAFLYLLAAFTAYGSIRFQKRREDV